MNEPNEPVSASPSSNFPIRGGNLEPPVHRKPSSFSQQLGRLALLVGSLGLWASAIYGTSQMHRMELPGKHGICGPWGCAAEPSALLGYHLFLLVLITPIVVIGSIVLQSPRFKRKTNINFAFWVFLTGLIGAIGIATWGSVNWLIEGNETKYALQRGLFLLATTPDFPAFQLMLSGLKATLFGKVRKVLTAKKVLEV